MKLLDLLVVYQRGCKYGLVSLFERSRNGKESAIKTAGLSFDSLKDYLDRKVFSIMPNAEGILQVVVEKEAK